MEPLRGSFALASMLMVDEHEEPHPVEQAIELLVFAPLGFALEARTLLPRFVERGRNQVGLARVVGKFAVRKGVEDLESLAADRQDLLVGLLRLAGIVGPESADHPEPAVAGAAESSAATADSPNSPLSPVEVVIGPPVESLPITDYDSLSASQVVPRLDSLTEDELESVRSYELANRGRKTILGKVAQLQKA